MSSLTNILALPLAVVTIEASTNEDWIDGFVYYVDGTSPPEQLDLRGIEFEMEIRRTAPDNEVILHATTKDGSLAFGYPPDIGYLIINISNTAMANQEPGQYVGDIVATDAVYRRRAIAISLEITLGVTR
jgi:hypothetical protein